MRRTLIAGLIKFAINSIKHRKTTPILTMPVSPPSPPSPTKLVAGSRRAATTTASALPLAELAAVGPEIAETAVTCFAITLVGLAIGFVLLRVEAAVEGEE